MAENTKIEWCEFTFNPWRGCTKVSAGCANCYAETMSGRNPAVLGMWGPNGTRVVASESQWKLPVKWDRMARDGVCYHCHGKSTRDTPGKCSVCAGTGSIGPHRPRVFCASLADVFEDWTKPMAASDGAAMFVCNECGAWRTMERMCHGPLAHMPLTMSDVRRRLFDLIDATPNLDWLLLTKRPENIAKMMPPTKCPRGCIDGKRVAGIYLMPCDHEVPKFRPNLWLGTSVENQPAADERIQRLLRVPAAVRFLSCEPLLSEVKFSRAHLRCPTHDFPGGFCSSPCPDQQFVDWVIVGGESGPDSRPCRVEWIRGIVKQCKTAGVPCFVKQLGQRPTTRLPDGETWPGGNGLSGHLTFSGDGFGNHHVLGLRDKKGGDPAEWPSDLRVRQFPAAKGTVPA